MPAVKICLLVPSLDAGDLVVQRARRLVRHHGHEVVLGLTQPVAALPPVPEGVRALDVAAAAQDRYDVAVATDWRTTAWLFEVPATRHVSWVDRLAHVAMDPSDVQRMVAQATYALPVDFIAAGPDVASALTALRPDARCIVVRPGIDKTPFAPGEPVAAGAPLRVLVDDRRVAPGDLTGVAVVAELREPVAISHVQPGDDAAARAARYAAADVLVMLAPGAGVHGSALEAMHAGLPVVALDASGAGDLVREGENGYLVAPDDPRGAAIPIDRLARDRALLAAQRKVALTTAAGWPSAEQEAATLDEALRRLVDEQPSESALWPTRLMGDLLAAAATKGAADHELQARYDRLRADPAYRLGVWVLRGWRSRRLAPLRRAAAPLVRALLSRRS
jgi:hypothetical protein